MNEINPLVKDNMSVSHVPLRILLLVHSLRRGGAERVLLEIAMGLRAKGHIVEIVAWLDVEEYDDEEYSTVPRYYLMPKVDYRWPWSVPRAASRLRALCEKFKPDVIELHTPTVAWVVAWARISVPCIQVIHGYGEITRRGSVKDWFLRQGDRLVNRFLNVHFIAVAPPMIAVASDHFGTSNSCFSCVPNGVNAFPLTQRSMASFDAPLIMMLGTLSPSKGQQWGIQAIRGLLHYHPKARLKIVGEGDFRMELESLIREMDLEGKVELAGRRDDVFALMTDSHIFWHLSESEGLPMVILEAMASGLPVVGFDVRGTRDVIVDGETGALVPFGDIQGVVQRTVDLLSDDFVYQEMSRKAKARVESRFSLGHMVDGHELVMLSEINKR